MLLYFETEKHTEAKLCLFLQTAFYRLVFPCFANVYLHENVILQKQIYLRSNSWPNANATECESLLYVVLCLARKNRLVMNKCNFLDHEYSFFNAIVSGLMALNTLKIFGPCLPETTPGFWSRPQLRLRSPLFSL